MRIGTRAVSIAGGAMQFDCGKTSETTRFGEAVETRPRREWMLFASDTLKPSLGARSAPSMAPHGPAQTTSIPAVFNSNAVCQRSVRKAAAAASFQSAVHGRPNSTPSAASAR
jgi:hypothetical protein